MKTRVSQSTFELIINNQFYFDKTYRLNDTIALGYQYMMKEFDFTEWVETGRSAKVEVIKILNNEQFLNDSGFILPRKYRFFEVATVEVYL